MLKVWLFCHRPALQKCRGSEVSWQSLVLSLVLKKKMDMYYINIDKELPCEVLY